MNSKEIIHKAAIDHLATLYDAGYVRKRMATDSYPYEWDTIIAAFKAGHQAKISTRAMVEAIKK